MKNLLLATIVTVLTSSVFACSDSEGFDLNLLNSAGERIATLNTKSGELKERNKSFSILDISRVHTTTYKDDESNEDVYSSTDIYSICNIKKSTDNCDEKSIQDFMENRKKGVVEDSLIITYKPFLKPIERSYMESVPTPRCSPSIK